ncbi:methyltransferase-like 26 isoform X2 [Anoplophora glabripennis]|nr:methyltransferase-like 26 isoform X2 [Anoplophora glabripennis]
MLWMKEFFSTCNFLKMSNKIVYPSAESNKGPILEVLHKHMAKNIDGQVLEIASGTGQHISYFAAHFPRLTFQPSEYDTSLFNSIKAYANETPTKNVKDPIRINVTDDWTTWGVPNDFDYVININMIHVTPFPCTLALFKNVCEVLKMKGLLIMYGPYANNGVLEPQSNRDFDKNIRASNPDWGVRDIQDLMRVADPHGIKIIKIYDLPSNNKCLVWKKYDKF